MSAACTRFLSNFAAKIRFFMNARLIIFIILMSFFGFLPKAEAQNAKIQTVVIDAGHGGKDAGAVGKKAKEKDITLAVAKKVGANIKKQYPEVKVYYTRTTDVFVELMERAKTANRNNADLFISIHCNAVANAPKTCGAETFIMGDHRNSANLAVAKRENASILYESNANENYGGFDPNSTEAYIAFSFIQSEFKQRSLEFAELVQNQLVGSAKRHERGVQQAGFLVLYKTAMPSVLVELGFISNPTEEAYMMSTEGQNTLASAIAKAFSTYKTNFEKNSVDMQQETVAAEENVAAPENPAVEETSVVPPVVDKNKGIVYKVQFTTRSRAVDNAKSVYKNLKDVDYYEHNGMFKYTAGCFATKAEADAYLKEVISKGYDGAFVVKFEDGVRK